MGVTPRRLAAVALAAATVFAATACGGDDERADGTITLTVDVFGQFGYEQLYRQYEATHPNVRIVERGTGSNLDEYSPKLTRCLAAGKGAGDIVAIEEGLLVARSERGTCRVVCFTPRHDLTLALIDQDALCRVVDAWVEQYQELGSFDYINHVQIFENRGAMMGASNPHPHGQIPGDGCGDRERQRS